MGSHGVSHHCRLIRHGIGVVLERKKVDKENGCVEECPFSYGTVVEIHIYQISEEGRSRR
jgi:hypothetical protein